MENVIADPAAARDSIVKAAIYPSIGIARVGNAANADAYIVGPEVIGGQPTLPDGAPARLAETGHLDGAWLLPGRRNSTVYQHRYDLCGRERAYRISFDTGRRGLCQRFLELDGRPASNEIPRLPAR